MFSASDASVPSDSTMESSRPNNGEVAATPVLLGTLGVLHVEDVAVDVGALVGHADGLHALPKRLLRVFPSLLLPSTLERSHLLGLRVTAMVAAVEKNTKIYKTYKL